MRSKTKIIIVETIIFFFIDLKFVVNI